MNDAQLAGVVGDNTFREGVVSGFLLILFSELGDKTFFIALLLALKQSQALVFAGTFGALAVMTVISVRSPFQRWLTESRLKYQGCYPTHDASPSPRGAKQFTFSTLQVFLGQTLHQLDELLPANTLPLDDLFAVALLVFFGVKTLLVTDRSFVVGVCTYSG